MSEAELKALDALRFDWTSALEDVWYPSRYHVEGLHAEATALIRRGIAEAEASARRNPLGLPLQGERGVGKTHLLGWAREQVRAAGGYFFLLGDLTRKTFWEEARAAFVQQLLPLSDGSRDQLSRLLGDLADRSGIEKPVRDAVTGIVAPTADDVAAFIAALRRLDPSVGLPCQDTARALVLLASPDFGHQDIGLSFLNGDDVEEDERRPWGIRSKKRVPQFVINQVSQLLAISGPAIVALDQIDALIDEVGQGGDPRVVREVATGLMALRDTTHRTFTIISCLPESWAYLTDNALDTVTDRFLPPCQMQNIPTADIGRLMIEKRFAADYARAGFVPPYPTWPVRPAAFEDATGYTARALLKRIGAHVAMCLRGSSVIELGRLSPEATADASTGTDGEETVICATLPDEHAFAAMDALFSELWEKADISAALVPGTEDALIPELLDAGLDAWIRERGDGDDRVFVREQQPRKNAALHAELRMIIDERTERQRRWGFRAISAEHATSVLSRYRNAAKAIGLDSDTANRQLFVLRSTPWPTGRKTEEERADFAAKGGLTIPATVGDLKTFSALRAMRDGRNPDYHAWLAKRRPAHGTDLLAQALGDLAEPAPEAEPAAEPEAAPDTEPVSGGQSANQGAGEPGGEAVASTTAETGRGTAHESAAGTFRIGATLPAGKPVSLDLKVLRRHAVLFAGSGSGKTVLLRRIIEECALQGVSTIVLDPNNDLARLGDAWPESPQSWADGDRERAREYLDNTDVVLWTPRRQSGRPLTFRPLPEFAAVIDDPDDFDAAIDAAVGAIAPRLIAGKGPQKANEETAVLREALRYYAKAGGSDFDGFVALLAELPEGVSTMRKAVPTASDLADRLQAARINDPLFAGEGEPVDPGLLLTPPPGKRARISVVSLIGLPELSQRQSFVNQLQMALFSWIKKHPARDRPLCGLLVMDEAQDLAPSGQVTPCSESTIRLVSQARKYGLGLLFATQAPKGIHNRITGNATTQFYGLLNHPVQIDAARDIARAKGGDVPDISRLSPGQFYVATDGTRLVKTATRLCLTHHPDGPLTEEEVIARASR
ncbi:MAG: hypothetical protein JWM19_5949 [Actinomycetia bacterium]|nr:hypothetical protein [Actinomycetes bacterium]